MLEFLESKCVEELNGNSDFVLAIICPFHNEEANMETLIPKLFAVENAVGKPVQIVLCDDGSSDASRTIALNFRSRNPLRCKVIAVETNLGQSRAWEAGIAFAEAPIIAFIDADGQNPPEEISRLFALLSPNLCFVKGYRQGRQDTLLRRVVSWFGNRIINCVFGVSIRDAGCSLAVYRKSCVSGFEFSNNLHRYLPHLLAKSGAPFIEVPVSHLPRKGGRSHYSLVRKILQVPAEARSHLRYSLRAPMNSRDLHRFHEIRGL